MIKQNKNQNVLYRPNREIKLTLGNFDQEGLYDKIDKQFNKKNIVYTFPEKTQTEVPVYSENNKNVFSIYDDKIYSLFKYTVSLIKIACKDHDLDFEKNKYFLSSSLITEVDKSFWYDTGGMSKPSLFGIISLDTEPKEIDISGVLKKILPGDIIISEAGNKIKYLNQIDGILFNVAPLSMIEKQYPHTWIPIL
jgi:hypothetical protein